VTIRPPVRKLLLGAHLASSVGWIGAVLAYMALGVAAVTTEDVQTVRAAWTAMELTGWYVIVPVALVSLLTGVVIAVGTKWGLFRHYWVLISFALTVIATVVLVLHMPTVSSMADVAQHARGASLDALGGDLVHSGMGLVILLVVHTLNVYKPVGVTRYGLRKQHGDRLLALERAKPLKDARRT
jgi:hypothetical protein